MENEKTPLEKSEAETVEAVRANLTAQITALTQKVDQLSAELIERNKTIQELLDGGNDPARIESEDYGDVLSKLRFVNK